MLALVIAEGVAIALLGLLVTGLLRSHAEILKALHDLGASVDPDGDRSATSVATPTAVTSRSGSGIEAATDIAGTGLSGDAVALAVTAVEHDTLLAFLSTGCTTCEPFWSAFRAGVDVPGQARLVVVTQSHESESRLRELAAPGIEVLASDEAWDAYGVPGSPHFVYVDGPSGRVVGEGTGPDWPAVRDLMSQAAADHSTRATNRSVQDVEWRDNPSRIDGELLTAGIGPGHPSLTTAPDLDRGSPDDRVTRSRHGRRGRCRRARDLVALRRVDACEHQPAR
jgi:hypothetical protein